MIKTIDIQAKEWHDRPNGNTYFSALITVNFGLENEEHFQLPFQYGYDEGYVYESLSMLKKAGLIETTCKYTLRENGIILRYSKRTNCKKRELIQ